jgi:ABC-type Zn uptake system ZnuABC Zn-binding protein ZnuA
MFFGPFWTWSCAILLTSSLTCAVSVAVAASSEPVNVVVTIPVLKDLAEQVGGPYIRVTSLLKGYENEHLSQHTTARDMNRAIPMSGWTPRTLRRCSGTSLMH